MDRRPAVSCVRGLALALLLQAALMALPLAASAGTAPWRENSATRHTGAGDQPALPDIASVRGPFLRVPLLLLLMQDDYAVAGVKALGPYGCAVKQIASDPGSEDIVYVWTGGTLYRSTDNAAHWTRIKESVDAFALDDASVVFVAQGGVISSSDDAGVSWTQLPALENTEFHLFAAVPGQPGHLYALRTVYVGMELTPHTALCISDDGGRSWNEIFDPATYGESWFGNEKIVAEADGSVCTITYLSSANAYNVHLSTDYGQTWSMMYNGAAYDNTLRALALDPSQHATALVGTVFGGIFKTTDAGAHWDQLSTMSSWGLAIGGDGSSYSGQDAREVFYSRNGGLTWQTGDTGLGNPHVLAVNAANCDRVYAGDIRGLGLARSTDAGVSWTPASVGITETQVNAFDANSTALFVSIEPNVLSLRPLSGSDWQESLFLFGRISAVGCQALNSATVYAGTFYDGMFKSTNNGQSWSPINTGLGDGYSRSIAVDTVDPQHVFCMVSPRMEWERDDLYVSSNAGASWSLVGGGLPTGSNLDKLSAAKGVSALYVELGGGLYRSTNHGQSWQALTSGLPGAVTAFAAGKAGCYAISGNKLYRVGHADTTWTALPMPLAVEPGSRVVLAADAGARDAVYVCVPSGTATQVLAMEEATGIWHAIKTLSDTAVMDCVARDKVFLLTDTQGILELTLR